MLYRAAPMGVWWYVVMAVMALILAAVLVTGIILVVRFAGRGGRMQRQMPGAYPPMPGSAPGPGMQGGPGAGPGVPASGGYPGPNPEDVLAQRFARGEIDEAEFRARMKVLGEHRGGA